MNTKVRNIYLAMLSKRFANGGKPKIAVQSGVDMWLERLKDEYVH